MNHEERFNVKRGAQGCLVASAILVVLNLFIAFVITDWLGLISIETEEILLVFVWLFAVCFAGYVAARLGKTTSWTNSLVVGLIAAFVVYTRLPKGGEGQILLDPLLETIKDPATHWLRLVWLGLTIPVAILGGIIWQKTGGSIETQRHKERREGDQKRH